MLIKKYSEHEYLAIKAACTISAKILDQLTEHIRVGISTEELDKICYDLIIKENAKSAYFSHKNYPKTIFTSINSAIRGIPSTNQVLKDGDIINIDLAINFNGFYGTTSRMYYVGKKVPKFAQTLCEVAAESLELAINMIHPKQEVDTVNEKITLYINSMGYTLISDSIKELSLDDFFYKHRLGLILEEGMIFILKPIINMGSEDIVTLRDSWSMVTKDMRLSAHFSHCIGVTDNGCEVFTRSPAGFNSPPYKV